MTPLSNSAVRAIVDVSCAAASALPLRTLSEEILTILRSTVPYAAATICAWDPAKGCHVEVANAGYPPQVLEYLLVAFTRSDPAYRYMRDVDTTPLRMQDTPFDYYATYSYQEVFEPAGYTGGMTTCLFTRDGRYTGAMHISTEGREELTPGIRALALHLQPVLAAVVDSLRMPALLINDLVDVPAAMVLPDGSVLELPGHPSHDLLHPHTALPRAVLQLARDSAEHRFLWRTSSGWHRMRIQGTGGGVLVAVEAAELKEQPLGLTCRELEVLTLLASGHQNAQIAEDLFISRRTVETYVDRVLEKLACATRTGSARLALDLGLNVLPSPCGSPVHILGRAVSGSAPLRLSASRDGF